MSVHNDDQGNEVYDWSQVGYYEDIELDMMLERLQALVPSIRWQIRARKRGSETVRFLAAPEEQRRWAWRVISRYEDGEDVSGYYPEMDYPDYMVARTDLSGSISR